MNPYLPVLAASITSFAATNLDDAFLLTLFYARRIPPGRIVAGQYAGFAAIIAISLAGAWAAMAVPHRWIHYLGLVPLAIGVRQLLARRQREFEPLRSGKSDIAAVALITLSNGADNVGVYVPFFVKGRPYLWFILTVYAAMVAIWCAAGRWLGSHPLVMRAVDRQGHWIVPIVFIGVGIYVLST